MTDTRAEGIRVLRDILPEMVPADDTAELKEQGFGGELGELSVENVFGRLWARPGLDRRSRSLVTLGILIALHAGEELKFHFPIALRNGLSREELEEVVYHAAGYAGFPAAATARLIARQTLDAEPSGE